MIRIHALEMQKARHTKTNKEQKKQTSLNSYFFSLSTVIEYDVSITKITQFDFH